MLKLPYEFYNCHVVEVAKDLLGKTLCIGNIQGIITEVEAYRGSDDEASYAFKGPTSRAAIMFGEPGYSYVYLVYGMYHCLNIVTEEKGNPSAVLIRGLKLANIHLDGPGKICKYLGLNKSHNGINLVSDDHLYLTSGIEIEGYKLPHGLELRKL